MTPRPNLASSCARRISMDLLGGSGKAREHAEDLTASVKSSACSHPFQEYSFRFLRLIQIVGSARPIFIDKFINRPTHSQGKLRAIFALSFPTMSYIYKFIDRALHQPTQKYSSVTGWSPAHPVTPLVHIGRRADDATTLISRPRALVVSRWIWDLMREKL